MYTEYEEKKGFPIRDFLIKLVLIIIFVLLLVWLLPIPNMKGVNNKIFNANIQEMKDTAITYFTTERLPVNVGDKVKLTLKEMIDLKLILPITDKDGKTCNETKSYVVLEKKETEYLMTVHLECGDEKGEIEVHLGCYSYCTSAICEKQEDEEEEEVKKSGPSCTLEVSGTQGGGNWFLSDATVKFKSKTTTGSAKITEYGLGTGGADYNKLTSYTVKDQGSTKVYGYVKDSEGKTAVCSVVVNKDTVKPSCELTVLSGTANSNGVYVTDVKVGFKEKTDNASGASFYGLSTSDKADYNNSTTYTITKNGSTKVYGYVKDKAGNTNTCDITIKKEKTEAVVSQPICSLEVQSGTLGSNGWYVSDVVVGFKSKASTNGATIKSFGIGQSKTSGNNDTFKVANDGQTVIYGYVKDSNGYEGTCSITVKKDSTKPTCALTVQSGVLGTTGSYTSDVKVGLTTRTDATSGVSTYGIAANSTAAYNKLTTLTIKNSGKHTIYGYIKDNAGNTNTCNIAVTKASIEYQYSRPVETTYSAWSDWTTKTYDVDKKPTFGISSDGLTENVDLGKQSAVIRYETGKVIYADQNVLVDSVTTKTCKGYDYYKYQDSTTTYAIKETEGWKEAGYLRFEPGVVPKDTMAVKFEYVKEDWDSCSDECTTAPYTIWKKYTRQVSTVTDSSTIVTSGVTVKCSEYETKTTNYYSNVRKAVGYTTIRVYGDVYQYKTRTRTILRNEYPEYTWSAVYNDQSLINAGYKMTGNTRYV